MKLIINIPDDVYTRLFDNGIQDNEIATDDICEMARALRLGTPIPDNATNILDAIKLEIKQEYDNQGDLSFNDGLAFTLEIIDKYARENRNENGTLDI
jgi:hypothetical protein